MNGQARLAHLHPAICWRPLMLQFKGTCALHQRYSVGRLGGWLASRLLCVQQHAQGMKSGTSVAPQVDKKRGQP